MSHRPALAFALLLVLSSGAGCIENMGDLKEALGVVPPPVPAPVYLPPVAKIDAPSVATVGVPVRLAADGSKDPQGLALLYAWDFGDGDRASGPIASHVYAAPGERVVRLTVTNAAGLSDEDTHILTIGAPDGAPTVALAGPASGVIGEPLVFEATGRDPEGAPLAFAWDFGDGSTSHEARATHAYARPGVYTVSVRVTDAVGQRAEASTRVVVDGRWTWEGAFAPAGPEPAKMSFPVAAGAKRLDVSLAFESGVVNDLEVVLLDAEGKEVARSDAGLGGAPVRTLAAEKPAPGEWSVRVVKDSGVSVAWTLEVRETLT
ncbi:MAG TPA: PKD domain-containing protein [Candidatus Thermoplasmatota archaeon]|nr:PKD domain-containing protein [Candidatus Thermoplasmatota archaeon]